MSRRYGDTTEGGCFGGVSSSLSLFFLFYFYFFIFFFSVPNEFVSEVPHCSRDPEWPEQSFFIYFRWGREGGDIRSWRSLQFWEWQTDWNSSGVLRTSLEKSLKIKKRTPEDGSMGDALITPQSCFIVPGADCPSSLIHWPSLTQMKEEPVTFQLSCLLVQFTDGGGIFMMWLFLFWPASLDIWPDRQERACGGHAGTFLLHMPVNIHNCKIKKLVHF